MSSTGPSSGFRLLQRLAEDVTELGFVESSPKQDGRNMIMVLGPHKKKAEAKVEMQGREGDAGRRAGRRREAEEHAERDRRARRPPGGTEEGARSLREPRPRDRGLSRAGPRRPATAAGPAVDEAREESTERCRRTRRTRVPASASG